MPDTENDSEAWIDQLAADIGAATQSLCQDIVGDEKFRLSRQANNERGGGDPVMRGVYDRLQSSVQGEPPRRRTGRLQESIQAAVETTADAITATLSTDTPYAGWLVDHLRLILTDRVDNGPLADEFADAVAKTI